MPAHGAPLAAVRGHVCRSSSNAAISATGWSTTPASRRKTSIRSASPGNIAVSRTAAKWPSRWPIARHRRVCASPPAASAAGQVYNGDPAELVGGGGARRGQHATAVPGGRPFIAVTNGLRNEHSSSTNKPRNTANLPHEDQLRDHTAPRRAEYPLPPCPTLPTPPSSSQKNSLSSPYPASQRFPDWFGASISPRFSNSINLLVSDI